MKDKEFFKRFRNETIYLYDDQEETYIKSVPGDECYTKLKGGNEFRITPDNGIVIRAMHAGNEVSKKEFDQAFSNNLS